MFTGDSLPRAAGDMPIFVSNYCTHMCNGVTNCVMQSLTELTGFEVFAVGVGEGRGAGGGGGGGRSGGKNGDDGCAACGVCEGPYVSPITLSTI